MAEFSALNDRLTSAVKNRLGEPVVLTPLNGGALSLRAVVRRGVELVGSDGRVADPRDVAQFDAADLPLEDLGGATLRIGTSEDRILDALVGRDGGMREWSLR